MPRQRRTSLCSSMCVCIASRLAKRSVEYAKKRETKMKMKIYEYEKWQPLAHANNDTTTHFTAEAVPMCAIDVAVDLEWQRKSQRTRTSMQRRAHKSSGARSNWAYLAEKLSLISIEPMCSRIVPNLPFLWYVFSLLLFSFCLCRWIFFRSIRAATYPTA